MIKIYNGLRTALRYKPVVPNKLDEKHLLAVKLLHEGAKIDRIRASRLKARIRFRLTFDDYTCRLPKVPKPRVRYKLRTEVVMAWEIPNHACGYTPVCLTVWR